MYLWFTSRWDSRSLHIKQTQQPGGHTSYCLDQFVPNDSLLICSYTTSFCTCSCLTSLLISFNANINLLFWNIIFHLKWTWTDFLQTLFPSSWPSSTNTHMNTHEHILLPTHPWTHLKCLVCQYLQTFSCKHSKIFLHGGWWHDSLTCPTLPVTGWAPPSGVGLV